MEALDGQYRNYGPAASDSLPPSRRDTQVRDPRGKGRLYRASRPECHVDRAGAIWGTLDYHGRNEEHNAKFPSTSLQQDKHPSTIQVNPFAFFLLRHRSAKPSLSFKANPNSRVVTVVDEVTGAEKKRYVNKDRWKGYGPVTAIYSDSWVRQPVACMKT